jgi:Protease inhibitor Inh
MTNLRSLALAAGLSFASVALAHADGAVTGTWKLTVGSYDAPCTLNIVADSTGTAGTATPSSDCGSSLADITHWKLAGRGLQLLSPGGEIVAWLNPKADAYVGDRVSDGRKLALNR